ncbi:MAG: DNA recombination protein RmuC [Acidimicrobiia bacterium]|nr:DNA recombination protein RmuC [Acidimicrobiia bacterium]MYG59761.1 DNA recombination protein RmuC [Acidimicrobiia bacterium]MYJ31539.1 DNA recombination protein RmuC [Acidimicrobiia bacterium]
MRDEREAALRKLAAAEAEHEARTEELAKAREELETQFKGIASNVVEANSKVFLEQAKAQFENQKKLSEADLKQRQQAIDELVKPVKENLAKFEKRVNEIEEKREGAYEGLTTQIGQLREATGGLREALRSPQVRGLWGEQTLRNILEVSGMREHIDFVEQHTVATDDGSVRPDAVVRVPGGVQVVIDAKTPLDSYLEAHNEKDEQRQGELLQSHARSLMGRAKELGDKDYAAAIDGSPDFTVMFVPADPILDAAVDVQPTIWEDAWQKHRVLIATPGLLLAFLRTVALAWQQQDLQENAQEIADGATALYDSLRVYAGHVDNVGKGLQRAVKAYNDSIGSLEGRVLPRARRFEELGPVSGVKRIEGVSPVEAYPRAVAAAELVEAEAVSELAEPSDPEDD